MTQNKGFEQQAWRYQRGALTIATCILVLVLMAVMIVYATRSGMSEQIMSANDLRQKRAFHVAESGINLAKEWLLANNVLINADVEDMLGPGVDGWFVAGSERWQQCGSVNYLGDKSHPCWGDSVDARRDSNYFYSWNGSTELPINPAGYLAGSGGQVTVQALLCLVNLDPDVDPTLSSPVLGCHTDPTLLDSSKFLVTLLARGQSDCDGTGCRAEALVSEQLSNFSLVAFAQGPGVPLVTKSTFPPSGTAEIVAHPNAGGLGVPVSVWANANTACPNHTPVDPSSGSWATCEAQEWYGTESVPDGVACNQPTCSCTSDEAISTTLANVDRIGMDIVADAAFPCDLFEFYFGVPRSQYQRVRDSVTVISDCSGLGPNSFGAYWVTGSSCEINANTTVGSPEHPVLIISAAGVTRLNGGSKIFGILFVTDVEDALAELRTSGNATVYGSVVADTTMGSFNGTFQIVYNDGVMADASGNGGLGSISGGWTDFHKEWE